MTYDEWHKANTKYMEPQDIDAWCEAAWNAAIEEAVKECDKVTLLHGFYGAASEDAAKMIKELRK